MQGSATDGGSDPNAKKMKVHMDADVEDAPHGHKLTEAERRRVRRSVRAMCVSVYGHPACFLFVHLGILPASHLCICPFMHPACFPFVHLGILPAFHLCICPLVHPACRPLVHLCLVCICALVHTHKLWYSSVVLHATRCELPLIHVRAVNVSEPCSHSMHNWQHEYGVYTCVLFPTASKPSCRDVGCKKCMRVCTKLILQCPVSTYSVSWSCTALLGTLAWSAGLCLCLTVGRRVPCMTAFGVERRRATNRESAKRIRDKREEQMTLMSEQVHCACLPSTLLVPKPHQVAASTSSQVTMQLCRSCSSCLISAGGLLELLGTPGLLGVCLLLCSPILLLYTPHSCGVSCLFASGNVHTSAEPSSLQAGGRIACTDVPCLLAAMLN